MHTLSDQQQVSGGPDVDETRVFERSVETDRGGAMDHDVHVGDNELHVGRGQAQMRFRAIALDQQHLIDEIRLFVPQRFEQL